MRRPMPVNSRLHVGLLLVLATFTANALATEEEPQAALRVTRSATADDCPNSATLIERVNAMTKRQAVSEVRTDQKLELVIALSHDEGVYRAEIRASGSLNGVRNIDDPGNSCQGLAAAVTVSVALLLDEARKAE